MVGLGSSAIPLHAHHFLPNTPHLHMYAVGVDLGGTNIKAGLVRRDGTITHQVSLPTEAERGAEHVVARVAVAVERVLGKGSESAPPLGVGIGSPGKVANDHATVITPPNFPGWGEINLAERLGARFPAPIVVENDANAAGIGSAHYGAGRRFGSFVMVTLGTGVGGAIVHEGKLFRGVTGGAGELGHVSIDYEGPYARSGIAGVIEAYLGNRFLVHHARGRLLTRETMLRELAGPQLDTLTPKMLHHAAERGDEAAREVLAWAGHKLGTALGTVVNLLDIRKVVVGGGISAAGDFILGPAREALRRAVLPAFQDDLEIVRETLGNEAAILGAAWLVFERADR